MAGKRGPQKRRPKEKKVTTPCPFCVGGDEPDYKKYKILEKYLSDRGKIVGRDRTGVCSRHQRRLSIAIKRARQMALLPFTPTL